MDIGADGTAALLSSSPEGCSDPETSTY
jgi:hypothetical protein